MYLDNIFAKNVYNAFKSETEEEKITIINLDVDMLPDNSPNWKHEEIDPILLNLGNSDAQVILMICYTQDATSILTRMWELGFRNQNRVIIAVGWLVKEMVMQDKASTTYNETRLNILRDSLRGSLMFFPVSFFGDFGEQIFKFYQTKFTSDPVGYSGFAFDAVMAAAYALDQVITQGKDYNDPKILINAIRNIRFVGATGIVKIEDKANDRAPMDHNIFNCKEISKDNWEVRKVGVFSPTGSKVFTYYEDIIWPDGTSVTPSDTPDPLDCPFEDSESKSSFKGFMMMCSIGLVVIAAAIISSSLV